MEFDGEAPLPMRARVDDHRYAIGYRSVSVPIQKMNSSFPPGSPSGGAAELARLRGCPWFGEKTSKIGTLYLATYDTPSDLASSATSLREGGKRATIPIHRTK